MSENEEGGVEMVFTRPRVEGGSLVLTIPKHVCDKLRISKGSRLHLILYDSFVILKQREKIEYEREPTPKILELLDRVFELFRQEDELKRKRYFEESLDLVKYDSRMKEIHSLLKDTSSKILGLLKEKKWFPEAIPFAGKLSVDEVLFVLRVVYDKNYKESKESDSNWC